MARQDGLDIRIYHGSVMNMPFDNKLYGGIFCYALIHLLSNPERKKFIKDCYSQLKPSGYMIFTTISKKPPMFGKGRQLSRDRFDRIKGIKMLFCDSDSIKRELESMD
jgi:2-polyprenyl-3-methyl-5-hydroxy-6-metoxy-1,4-benzoquinol methylase